MGRDRDPYERTLGLLRERLRAGAFGVGRPLNILRLAEDMAVSSTPVREALAWLAGEGLIERGPGGYASRRLDGADLAGLYRLDGLHAFAALGPPPVPSRRSPASPPGEGYLAGTEHALARLATAQGQVLREARRGVWDRLAPFRRLEPEVLASAHADLAVLEALAPSRSAAPHLRAYFQRRVRRADTLLAVAYSLNIK